MDPPQNGPHLERTYRVVGVAVIVGGGVLMGVLEVQHIRRMSSSIGIAVFALLPFIIDVGLILAGVWLWRSRYDGNQALRVAAWVLFGMVVVGLLATWTISHQNIRGRPFAHAQFVTVNNLSAGGLIGFVFGWYDITRRQYQEELETERSRLEFLHSSLRHNILNGLSVILTRANLLEEDPTEPGQHLQAIRSRGQEMQRFTESTKTLLENFLGRAVDSRKPIELRAVLEEELEKTRDRYAGAEFSMEVPEAVYFEGDDLAGELFDNIISNAVQHNDKQTPEVEVTAKKSENAVVVSVADNGPGIPDDEKHNVRGWNVKGVESTGHGLGLAIAETIASRYGGRLWIEDNDPEGTIVNVQLPTINPSESMS